MQKVKRQSKNQKWLGGLKGPVGEHGGKKVRWLTDSPGMHRDAKHACSGQKEKQERKWIDLGEMRA